MWIHGLHCAHVKSSASARLKERLRIILTQTQQKLALEHRLSGKLGQGFRKRVLAGQFQIAVAAQHKKAMAGHLPGEKFQQEQRRLAGPMEVIEHQNHGLTLARIDQECGRRVEQGEPGLLRFQSKRRLQVRQLHSEF